MASAITTDEAKHLDWRRKLGGMLAREMDWKDKHAPLGNGMYVRSAMARDKRYPD